MARVLFQSSAPALFRASSIGYLYEIAQKHQVILLTRELDPYTLQVLHNKRLFPGLEKIFYFDWPFHGDIFRKNSKSIRLGKEMISSYAPDVVIAQTDIWPPDSHLVRHAKRKGIPSIVMQSGFKIDGQKKLYLWSCLINSQIYMPRFLPFFVSLFFVKAKKYLGHFLYYWILPLAAGETPFFGKGSFVFWDESWGLRDAEYSTVFSKRDYDICLKDGVKKEKLLVIGHPLEHPDTKSFFKEVYFSKNKKEEEQEKTATLMWAGDTIGFKDADHTLIPEKEIKKRRIQLVKTLARTLEDWKIFIKPHPALKEIATVQNFFGELPSNVTIVHPSEPADTYIEMSNVIIGVPPPSTTLFSASKQNSEKIILSLNLDQEFIGDSYKDFSGIEYIDTQEKFIAVLRAIEKGTYQRKNIGVSTFDFTDAAELVDSVYNKHRV